MSYDAGHRKQQREDYGDAGKGPSGKPGGTTRSGQHRRRATRDTAEQAVAQTRRKLEVARARLPTLAIAVDPAGARDIDAARQAASQVEIGLLSAQSEIQSARGDAEEAAPDLLPEVEALVSELEALKAEAAPLLARRPPSYQQPDDQMSFALALDDNARMALDAATARERTDWNASLDQSGAVGGARDEAPAVDRAEPLPDRLRGPLETASNTSLAGVQVHTGPRAAAMASSHAARAVTIGQDIHFAEDEEPDGGSDDAEHLVAHEVAHTIQQRSGAVAAAAKARDGESSAPAEREADRFADAVVGGSTPAPIQVTTGQRAAAKKQGADSDLASEPAALVASQTELAFPSTTIGDESAPITVTLTNAGASPINIEDVFEVAGKGKTLVFPTYAAMSAGPIEAGDSVDVQFAFRPAADGTQSTTYQIVTDGGFASVTIKMSGVGVAGHTAIARLKARPKRIELATTKVGEYSPPETMSFENVGEQPVVIEEYAVEPSIRESEFLVSGKSDAAPLEPGEVTEVSVTFKPERPRERKAKILVKANGGATVAKVKLVGEALSRDASDAEVATADSKDRYKDAVAGGDVGPTRTYREMLAALFAAQRLTKKGDDASYQHALPLVEAVNARMDEIVPAAEKALGDYGTANLAGLMTFGAAHRSVWEWKKKLEIGSSINVESLIGAFEVGEEPIKLATGEAKDGKNLRVLQEYGNNTAIAVGALAVAAVVIPIAIEAAPVIISEAGLLGASARWVGTELSIWAAGSPYTALALSEILVGLGIQIGEGGWDSFAGQFEDNESFMYLVMQIMMDVLSVYGAQAGDHQPAPRGRQRGEPDSPGPSTPRDHDGEAGTSPGGKRSGKQGSGGADQGGEASLSPEAAQLRDRVIDKVRKMIDAITSAVTGKRTGTPDQSEGEEEAGQAKERSSEESEQTEPTHAEETKPKRERSKSTKTKTKTRKRSSGRTRGGIKRDNPAQWRKIRDSWDAAGYGGALSEANRKLIKAGRVPHVDDAWVEWFPGDAAFMGEEINIHHIKGGKLNVPLPESRHIDAHMPGGFKDNPGGPGMTGSLDPDSTEDDGTRAA